MFPPVDETFNEVIADLEVKALLIICCLIAPPPAVASLIQLVWNRGANVDPLESASISIANFNLSPDETEDPAGIESFVTAPPDGVGAPEVFVM